MSYGYWFSAKRKDDEDILKAACMRVNSDADNRHNVTSRVLDTIDEEPVSSCKRIKYPHKN